MEEGNDWVPEFRPVERSWGESMAQALIDAGMERARIGVSGIRRGFYTHGRAFHGVVNHSSYVEVLRRLPNATFENATEIIGYARYVKSEEQIECLEEENVRRGGDRKMMSWRTASTRDSYAVMGGWCLWQRVLSHAFYKGLHGGGRLPREDPRHAFFAHVSHRQRSGRGLRRIDREQQPILGHSEAWKPPSKPSGIFIGGMPPYARRCSLNSWTVNGFGESAGLGV
jgi:hypothetical protein